MVSGQFSKRVFLKSYLGSRTLRASLLLYSLSAVGKASPDSQDRDIDSNSRLGDWSGSVIVAKEFMATKWFTTSDYMYQELC